MNKVVKVALGQVGTCESPAGSNRTKYGKAFRADGQPWCAMFIWWCFREAGLDSLFPHNANAAYSQDEVASRCGGKWIMKKTTSRATREGYLKKAKPGDIVTFDFGAFDAYRDHIGIVKEVSGTQIICIEGNTTPDGKSGSQSNGGMVCIKSRSFTSICAAVRPAYSKAEASSKGIASNTDKPVQISGKCLDISAWQGEISVPNWKKARKEIPSVILRSSYTNQGSFTLNKDKYFDANIRNAAKAGMNIGIYHYSQAVTVAEAKKEAEYCLKCIEPYRDMINLPVAFDWEFGGRLNAKRAKANGKTRNTEICSAFCSIIKKAGYDTMVYANLSTLNNYLSANLYKSWKIWVAQYNSSCDYAYPYYLWQYTSSGSCEGISGRLDISRFTGETSTEPKKTSTSEIQLPARGYFQKGDTGEDVIRLQKLLNRKNKGCILKDLDPDGEYGPKTEKHVKLFQDVRKLTIDGQVGEETLPKLQKAKMSRAWRAVNWAVSVARDNSFAYGTGERAHHGGCYFCGTNITGPKKAEKGSKWEKTYCCNPFIFSAYAHGTGTKKLLAQCKKSNAATGMDPKAWAKFGFEILGKCSKVEYFDLKPGDVIMCKSHVWMFTGSGWLVEAHGGGWGPDSIAHKHTAKGRYTKYRKDQTAYVVRYKG